MSVRHLLPLLLLNYFLLAPGSSGFLWSQKPDFELVEISLDKSNPTGIGTVDLRIRAMLGRDAILLDGQKVSVLEKVGEAAPDTAFIFGVVADTVILEVDSVSRDPFVLTFILDRSVNMGESGLSRAKQLINETLDLLPVQQARSFQLLVFDADIQAATYSSAEELSEALRGLELSESPPDLNRALMEGIRFTKRFPEKQLLFVLSNGFHNIEDNPYYQKKHLPYDNKDVIDLLLSTESDLALIAVGLGEEPNEEWLGEIVETVSVSGGQYSRGELPKDLSSLIRANQVLESNYIVKVRSNQPVFIGESREYTIVLKEYQEIRKKSFIPKDVSSTDPIDLRNLPTLGRWLGFLALGAVLLIIFWAISSITIPFLRKRYFRQNYVKEYVAESNRRRIDPLTKDVIQPGQLVVVKCQQITPLTTWEGVGGQCPNYPDCLDFNNCDGAGAPDTSEKFFSGQGPYRNLNWIWFGATGGFAAWGLFALFRNMDFGWYRKWLGGLHEKLYVSRAAEQNLDASIFARQADILTNDTLIGVAFGAGLIFMLALAEERSQARRISWGRILLRTLIGILVSFLIFMLSYYWSSNDIIPGKYLNGLLTWLLFGLSIGMILSIRSSIMLSRGILGGILAGLVAFHAYYGLSDLFQDFLLARLISLILLGAILGGILVTVITRLEDFELEYITPERFQHVVPISKWLKANIDIYIGTDSSSYVYVKWEDGAVQPQHAKLLYEKGTVYIIPKAETLVRGRPIPIDQKTALRNGDILQLGKESITRMRYREKHRSVKPGNQRTAWGNRNRTQSSTSSDDDKPRIRIKR